MKDSSLGVDYEAVLADLRARRAALDAAIASIEQIVAGGIPAPSAQSRKEAREPVGEIESDTFFNMTVPDASRKYLAMMRKPQTTVDIAAALERGGFTHQSEKFVNTVGAVLHRVSTSPNADVVKVSRGRWGLASWYGPKRPEKSRDELDTNGGS
jgi:hypothetical protein